MTPNPDLEPDIPELDAPRSGAEGRVIMDVFDAVEPFLPEIDGMFSMPLRLVHNDTDGWIIELGPYDLHADDILQLRKAIAAYYRAIGAPNQR